MSHWEKLGCIFAPDGVTDWMVSHASNPIAEPLPGSRVRVYFSTRDGANRSSIAFFECDLRAPDRIVRVAERPVVSPGQRGEFDDSGASGGCLVICGGRRLLYYVGWNLGITVPWRNSIGLAIAEDDSLLFRRVSAAPIIDRSEVDPLSLSYPWVLRNDRVWRMWYGSHLAWGPGAADMTHVIKEARSTDGLNWQRDGGTSLQLRSDGEYALSRPCVVRDPDCYRMWYSRRGSSYRIGYAESSEGSKWHRLDNDAGILPSNEGWDSEMVEYPCVFDHAGERWLLYNGNGYGRSGVGLAVLVE